MPNRIHNIWAMWKWDLGMLTGGVLLFVQSNVAGLIGFVTLAFSAHKWWQQSKLIKMQQENERLDQEIKKVQLEKERN